MRIQHNIPAMSAYRNYTNNQSALAKNLEKLSSGFKINRAGDDAAGLAISEKMRAQITGLEVAQKNAKDGISLVQTAEGALTEVHDMLNRMYELAEQSANGTYDNDVDRRQLQKELSQLRTEIDRIADSSNFNGINLLDGSMSAEGTVENYTNAMVTAIQDGSPVREACNGEYRVDLSQIKWSVAQQTASGTPITPPSSQAGSITLQLFGSADRITVKIHLKESRTSAKDISGEEIAEAICEAIQAGQAGATGTWTNTGSAGTAFIEVSFASSVFAASDDTHAFRLGGKAMNVKCQDGVLTFKGVDDTELSKKFTSEIIVASATGVTNDYGDKVSGNQGLNRGWKVVKEAVKGDNTKIAQAAFDLSKINIKDGTTLKIGNETYTFAVGKKSKFKDAENVVDLTDLTGNTVDWTDAKTMKKVASRLTGAAVDNDIVHVTTQMRFGSTATSAMIIGASGVFNKASEISSTASKACVIFLTEKLGKLDRNEFDVIGEKIYDKDATSVPNASKAAYDATWKNGESESIVQYGQAVHKGKALTLQIGDTAEDFNQLKVSVKDCHSKSIGIGDVDISTQEGGVAAMTAIKDAINYVSDVRGTLGATQNRLDHTINNLSVMQENIQDAESTIRDVDVAAEMMEYTKNNILVQSAQAMLAQANQLPQGVLQLLQ